MAGALVAILTYNLTRMMEQIKPQASCFCYFSVGGVSVLGGLVGSIWVASSHIHTGICCNIFIPIWGGVTHPHRSLSKLSLVPKSHSTSQLLPETIVQLPWPWDIEDSVRHLRFFCPATHFSSREKCLGEVCLGVHLGEEHGSFLPFIFLSFPGDSGVSIQAQGHARDGSGSRVPSLRDLHHSSPPCCCSSPLPHPPLETLV